MFYVSFQLQVCAIQHQPQQGRKPFVAPILITAKQFPHNRRIGDGAPVTDNRGGLSAPAAVWAADVPAAFVAAETADPRNTGFTTGANTGQSG
ncbi:hypothetical protein [Paenibacillus sp. FSL R7-0331]|uniref:hypothetical protein n=1 Tax=Paenibacillus sp. FSL R7-0331 TaxID=1536773 RepID=UPI00069500D4|nr:hypothetical protein [Paenibacillus sp. FSL R7-0331]